MKWQKNKTKKLTKCFKYNGRARSTTAEAQAAAAKYEQNKNNLRKKNICWKIC